MCLSIPYQIKKINGFKASVTSYKKKNRIIDLNILPKVNVGDWVLVLNNFAVNKISASEAKQIINLYKYE